MKKILFLIVVGGLIAAGWFYLKKSKSEAETTPETREQPAARVETTPLKRQSISQTLEVFGVVAAAPSGDHVVAAAFDCLVRKVNAVPGARVAAGDVLLEIEPNPESRLALDSARNALASAVKSLGGAKERFDLKLTTSEELRTAEQAELDARQKVASFETRGLGGDGRIAAPVAGVVGKLEVSAGSGVTAGTTLVTITSDAGLEARLSVEVSDAAKVVPGQAVILVSTHRSESGPISSTVRLTGGSLDPVSGSVEVRVPVPPGAALLLGEHVSASIELLKKEALVVPRRAVLPDDDKQILYTSKAGLALRHEVAVGITAGDLIEVSAPDLHEGDSVVTLGNYELSSGMAIQPAAAKEKAEEAKP